jgi:hypothetical protein
MSIENGDRVRLMIDLTRYHKSLVAGTKGRVIGPCDAWSRQQPDRFVGVEFPEKVLSVLIKSLEKIED